MITIGHHTFQFPRIKVKHYLHNLPIALSAMNLVIFCAQLSISFFRYLTDTKSSSDFCPIAESDLSDFIKKKVPSDVALESSILS